MFRFARALSRDLFCITMLPISVILYNWLQNWLNQNNKVKPSSICAAWMRWAKEISPIPIFNYVLGCYTLFFSVFRFKSGRVLCAYRHISFTASWYRVRVAYVSVSVLLLLLLCQLPSQRAAALHGTQTKISGQLWWFECLCFGPSPPAINNQQSVAVRAGTHITLRHHTSENVCGSWTGGPKWLWPFLPDHRPSSKSFNHFVSWCWIEMRARGESCRCMNHNICTIRDHCLNGLFCDFDSICIETAGTRSRRFSFARHCLRSFNGTNWVMGQRLLL